MTSWFLSPSPCSCEDRQDSNLFACLASSAGFHSSTSSKSHSSCSVVRAADFAFNLAKDIVSVRREPKKRCGNLCKGGGMQWRMVWRNSPIIFRRNTSSSVVLFCHRNDSQRKHMVGGWFEYQVAMVKRNIVFELIRFRMLA